MTNSNAKLNAKVSIAKPIEGNISIQAVLSDSDKNVVKTEIFDVVDNTADINFNSITNPNLWDTKNPYLYGLTVKLIENEKVIDQVNENVGFRWFEFKDYGAFYLNGKRLKLRGTHRHEEHAGVGSAMSNSQHRADIELIKEMGANFIRLAHYPQDPEIYKACDELGILVWDELPWCRGGLRNDTWKKNTKNMLKEMIYQNYNHPSIIIWSLGNEIYWLPDFEGGDNIDELNDLNSLPDNLNIFDDEFFGGSEISDTDSSQISNSNKNYKKVSFNKVLSKINKYFDLIENNWALDKFPEHISKAYEICAGKPSKIYRS